MPAAAPARKPKSTARRSAAQRPKPPEIGAAPILWPRLRPSLGAQTKARTPPSAWVWRPARYGSSRCRRRLAGIRSKWPNVFAAPLTARIRMMRQRRRRRLPATPGRLQEHREGFYNLLLSFWCLADSTYGPPYSNANFFQCFSLEQSPGNNLKAFRSRLCACAPDLRYGVARETDE